MAARWAAVVVATVSAVAPGAWRAGAAGAAGTAGAGAVVPGAGGICELHGVDRAITPSHRCVPCHDASAGPGVTYRSGATAAVPSASHPVGVDYGTAAARDPRGFAAPGAIPGNVPLVAGRVECTSCHDGDSSAPKHVAEPAQRLCNACHLH